MRGVGVGRAGQALAGFFAYTVPDPEGSNSAMRWISAALCVVLLMIACGTATAKPRRCAGEGKDEICVLAFGDLWAGPEQYDGRNVILSGFLVIGFGQLVLYPDYGYFFFQQGAGGIRIETDDGGFDAARARMREVAEEDRGDWSYFAPCPVTVQGVYVSAPSGDQASLGRIATGGIGLTMELAGVKCPMTDPATMLKMPGGRLPKPKDWKY